MSARALDGTAARASGSVRTLTALAHAGIFVFGIVMALVGAVVPALSERLPLTLGDIGALFLAMNFAMLLASLAVGLVMDRWGLKLPLVAGAALVALGLLLIATAAQYPTLLFAAGCLGLGGGALNADTNTLVADLHEDPNLKAAALNMLGVFFGFGALFMPFTLGALTARFGIAPLLTAAAALCIAISLASASVAFPAPKQRQGWPLASMPRFVRMPVIVLLALLLFFESGNEFLLGGYISSFLTRELNVPLALASYWLAGFWGSIMAARFILSRALLSVSAPVVVLTGAAIAAVGTVLIAMSTSVAAGGIGIILTGLALAGVFPSVLGFTGARFREHSGTVFGLLFTVALSGGMTIPWAAGHLAEAQGIRSAFIFAAVNFAAVTALMAAARRARE